MNASIYSRLWDLLESEREDCRFVYISHRLDFIESRNGVDYIWFKSFTAPDNWDSQFLETETIEKFPKDLLIQITGVKKDVLFCEGNDKTSLDYAVYQALFPELTVIPVGSCDRVKQYTKAYNSDKSVFINRAFGLIDYDLRVEDEVLRLKENRIFVTDYLETEMLLCDEDVIKAVLGANYLDEKKLVDFRDKFIQKMTERKPEVIKRRLKKEYENCVQSTFYDTSLAFEENLSKLTGELNRLHQAEDFKKVLDTAIEQGNYPELLKLCTLEHEEITGGLGNQIIDNGFEDKAKRQILNNPDLKKILRNKYFTPELFMRNHE